MILASVTIGADNVQRIKSVRVVFWVLLAMLLWAPVDSIAEGVNAAHSSDDVTLYYFWSRYCPHCQEAKPFISKLPKTYDWLTVHSYDLVDNKANQQLFLQMAEQLQ